MAQGAHYTLRIAVEGGPWDAGSQVTIGLRGKQLEAAHMLHAVLTESLNQQFEDYAEFVFSPDAHAWSFAFNLDGRGDDGPIKLNDMNCRVDGATSAAVVESSAPLARVSSPPPPSPGPSSADSDSYEVYYTYNGEIVEMDPDQRVEGGGASAGRLVAWLVPLLGLAAAFVYVRRNPAVLPALRARMGQSVALPPSTRKPGKQYAHCEDEMERAVDEDERAGVTNTSGAVKGAGSKKKKQKWTLSIELQGGPPFLLTLPMAAASSPLELKQAIAETCMANLGMEVTPESWQEDEELDEMSVKLLDAEGETVTLRDSTDFDLVLGCQGLRVTERRRALGMRSISIEP